MWRFSGTPSLTMTRIQDNIREWLKRHPHMNRKRLSEEAGLGPTYVGDILRNRSKGGHREKLTQLATFMGMTLQELTGENGNPMVDRPGNPSAVLASGVSIPSMGRDLPVHGTAEAGPQGAMQLTQSGAVDYVRRPPALATARDAYALYVVGDSMSPVFESGALVFVHPHRPAHIGDYVVAQVNDSKGNILAYLKKLKKIDGNRVVLEQTNPTGTITLKRSELVGMHKVLTMNELFGV